MEWTPMDTYFAPAIRAEKQKFKNQVREISSSPIMSNLLDVTHAILMVMNENRQVIGLNHAFLDSFDIQEPDGVLGLRLGEIFHCIHSTGQPNGCGTTPYCVTCGAAKATMNAINKNIPDKQICALTAQQNGEIKDVCLSVQSKPFSVDGNRWILLYAEDITKQQFWNTLEQTFFHDVTNVLTALVGNSELLAVKFPHQKDVQRIRESAMRISHEITLQRSMSQKKDVHFVAQKTETSIGQIRQDVDQIVSGHKSAKNKRLKAAWPGADKNLFTDSTLVSRVLGNMLINALEATDENGVVTLTSKVTATHVIWEVWSKAHISSDVQKRIFQRHFSTKSGAGRGLGTYSMKLFGEKYLGGDVTFVSTEKGGTLFKFCLPFLKPAEQAIDSFVN